MNREEALLDRIRTELVDAGHKDVRVWEHNTEGLGDFHSFFDVLVENKLLGSDELDSEAVWVSMKMQINQLRATISKGGDEYLKLQNKYRGLQGDYQELLKDWDE